MESNNYALQLCLPEIWLQIFASLAEHESIIRLRLVCKTFKSWLPRITFRDVSTFSNDDPWAMVLRFIEKRCPTFRQAKVVNVHVESIINHYSYRSNCTFHKYECDCDMEVLVALRIDDDCMEHCRDFGPVSSQDLKILEYLGIGLYQCLDCFNDGYECSCMIESDSEATDEDMY